MSQVLDTESYIDMNDYSKRPLSSQTYADLRGVVDFGNLMQFAPFEGGYCFLAVINAPFLAKKYKDDDKGKYFYQLQNAFVKILEQEFRGLSGIEGITAETMDITDGITTMSLIGKVNQASNNSLSMTFTEKSGTVITKYIGTYLRWIRDPKTQAKTYGGLIKASDVATTSFYAKEVFNMLYIITDSTCLQIEKAFLILNAQPMEAAYGDLYNMERGDIGTKDITVNWNAFVVDGMLANKIAHVYMRTLIRNYNNQQGKIQLNSYEFDYSISGLNGRVGKTSELTLTRNNDNEVDFSFNGSDEKGPRRNDYLQYEGIKETDKTKSIQIGNAWEW